MRRTSAAIDCRGPRSVAELPWVERMHCVRTPALAVRHENRALRGFVLLVIDRSELVDDVNSYLMSVAAVPVLGVAKELPIVHHQPPAEPALLPIPPINVIFPVR